MRLYTFGRTADQHQVDQTGKRRVVGSGTAHVDDALLKTDDFSRGDYSHTLQDVGNSAADRIHLGQYAGELTSSAADLDPRFNDVLDRGYADTLSGLRYVKGNRSEPVVILKSGFFQVFFRYVKDSVFNLRKRRQPYISDVDVSHFQFQDYPSFNDLKPAVDDRRTDYLQASAEASALSIRVQSIS